MQYTFTDADHTQDRRDVLLNVPVLVCIGILVGSGQLLQFSHFPLISGGESAWILLSIVCYSAAITSLAAVVGGLISRVRPGVVSAVAWAVLLSAATIYLVDDFSYSWLALHLDETFPLLLRNVESFQIMRSKLEWLVFALCAYTAALAVSTTAIWHGTKRLGWCAEPVSIRRVAAVLGVVLVLLAGDRAASPRILGGKAYEAKNDVLWQIGLFPPRYPWAGDAILEVETPTFRQVPDERAIEAVLTTVTPRAVPRPLNVFLIVGESLREDAITDDLAPNLFRLDQQALPIQAGVASSNVTHISWFSLLHAVNPLYWSVEAHQAHSNGAIPMRLLHKAGYEIRVLSSSNLSYYRFAQSVFGDDARLATSLVDQQTLFDPATDEGEGDVDEKLMGRLAGDLDTLRPESRVFYLIMLEAGHHDYTWSKQYPPKYLPFMAKVPLFATSITPENIEPLRNRYKNSVNFTDGLVGAFLRKLAARGLMDHSIVIVTGDHGEEFLERGHLAHSSELNRFQIRVPILITVPGTAPGMAPGAADVDVASHVDIFPTVFDALGLGRQARVLLQGRSLLGGGSDRVAWSAMTSSHTPSEALLDGGDYKLLVQIEGAGKLGRTLYARRLVGTKLLDQNDDEVTLGSPGGPTVEQIRKRFLPAIELLLVK